MYASVWFCGTGVGMRHIQKGPYFMYTHCLDRGYPASGANKVFYTHVIYAYIHTSHTQLCTCSFGDTCHRYQSDMLFFVDAFHL